MKNCVIKKAIISKQEEKEKFMFKLNNFNIINVVSSHTHTHNDILN